MGWDGGGMVVVGGWQACLFFSQTILATLLILAYLLNSSLSYDHQFQQQLPQGLVFLGRMSTLRPGEGIEPSSEVN